ncbi:MAG: 2-hydroxyacyl-CoA dehydratase family protein [Chloroflexi bacterium]|nr:2-hydroxyacyl-CoA dehydratase family protein [Chloroflexota bacterium]
MKEIMQQFRTVVDAPYEKLAQWKEKNNKKVVACTPMHFPEELIHAGGMLPIVLQETQENITEGFSHMYTFYCGITRNIVDIGVKKQLDFLDGVIVNHMCVEMQCMASTLRQHVPFKYLEYAQIPMWLNRANVTELYVQELTRIKTNLEAIAGKKIDDASLKQSIKIYNKNRSLLRRLNDIRRANPGLFSFKDMVVIVHSGMLMPKEEHSQLLVQLLAKLEKAKAPPVKGKKLLLSGHLCQPLKADIISIIESVGGIISDDDLYVGSRYYALDADENGNPLEAFAKRALDKSLPIPTQTNRPLSWEKYLADKAKASKVQGVVVLIAKYCEPHLFNYPFIRAELEACGIPHIMLETEHEIVSLEGLRTRLQAFVEMLK